MQQSRKWLQLSPQMPVKPVEKRDISLTQPCIFWFKLITYATTAGTVTHKSSHTLNCHNTFSTDTHIPPVYKDVHAHTEICREIAEQCQVWCGMSQFLCSLWNTLGLKLSGNIHKRVCLRTCTKTDIVHRETPAALPLHHLHTNRRRTGPHLES